MSASASTSRVFNRLDWGGSAPSSAAGSVISPAEVTVILPTLNEAAAIDDVLEGVANALTGWGWRVIVVDDDSPDGTGERVKRRAQYDARVSCIRRVGRRGLAGAVLEGALASATPLIAVIDADGQHDPAILPRLLLALEDAGADVAVASRYLEGGGAGDGFSPMRRRASHLAARLCGWLVRPPLSDPLSGCFVVRRACFDQVANRLSGGGFKILLDLLMSQPTPLRTIEVPLVFSRRVGGRSKLDLRVLGEYAGLVCSRVLRGVVTGRALMFGAVGASGLAIHMGVLSAALHWGFARAEVLAAFVAMTSNYVVNNALTYRDRRLRGWRFLVGYAKFAACCSLGFGAGVSTAILLDRTFGAWWLAGASGAIVGAGWNYLTTALLVW